MYVLRQLVTLSTPLGGKKQRIGEPFYQISVNCYEVAESTAGISKEATAMTLSRFYPFLVQVLSFDRCIPVMWVLPSEYIRLFPSPNLSAGTNGDYPENGSDMDGEVASSEDVGDGSELLEVSARDLARRCLEIVGDQLGLGPAL